MPAHSPWPYALAVRGATPTVMVHLHAAGTTSLHHGRPSRGPCYHHLCGIGADSASAGSRRVFPAATAPADTRAPSRAFATPQTFFQAASPSTETTAADWSAVCIRCKSAQRRAGEAAGAYRAQTLSRVLRTTGLHKLPGSLFASARGAVTCNLCACTRTGSTILQHP